MQKITLICTQHAEKGACNFNELYRIVEKIQPDVIFEELPPYAFNDYHIQKSKTNLEVQTINVYLEKYSIRNIPVDLDFDPNTLIEENGKVHRQIEAKSHDYRRLIDWNSQYVAKFGFRYLNSEECNKINSEIYDVIEKTLEKLNDEKLLHIHRQWKEVIEKRENEMIHNIYQYCYNNEIERGLFFIGAAHRKSIIGKIRAKSMDDGVHWKYDDYEGIL